MWVSKEDIRVLITRHVLKSRDRQGDRTEWQSRSLRSRRTETPALPYDGLSKAPHVRRLRNCEAASQDRLPTLRRNEGADWNQASSGAMTLSNASAVYLRLFFLPFLNFTAVVTGLRAISGKVRRGSPRVDLGAASMTGWAEGPRGCPRRFLLIASNSIWSISITFSFLVSRA